MRHSRLCIKYLCIYKIYVPHQECSRLIIYDSNKAAVEISRPMKDVCAQDIGAQMLTFWARQNLQLLTPSQSGWRARSGDVASPSCSPQVGSALRPPSLFGRRLCRTVPAVVPARRSRPLNVRGREYFHLFSGKNQKPNSAHKCPITSIQIRT